MLCISKKLFNNQLSNRHLRKAIIKIFLELCGTLNISRTSERIGLTQPALTIWIKKIEEQLKLNLFLRTKKGLVLTPSGRRLEQKSKEMISLWENFFSEIKADETNLKGIFNFGVHQGVAIYTLPPIYKALQKSYPNIELQLKHDLSRLLTEEVISNKLDCALVMNPIRHPDLVIIPILNDTMGLWCLPNAKVIDTIIYNPNLIQAQHILKKLKAKKINFKKFIETDSFEVATQLANNGIGACIIPKLIARELGGNKLTNLHNNQFTYSDELCLVYKAGFQKSKVAECLIKTIKENLSDIN